jgi:hypothetical protein
MSSRKYVGRAKICRPETGENMSAQKKKFRGATPEHPCGGLCPSNPTAHPAQALRHYYSCKEYNTYPTNMPILRRKPILGTGLVLEKDVFGGNTYCWKGRPNFEACATSGKKATYRKRRKNNMPKENQRGT